MPELLQIANIGIWPLIMGGTMYLQQKLNPQPADPTQAKIFLMLPIVFTFMLGQFPAGLVIYWAWKQPSVDRPAMDHHAADGRDDVGSDRRAARREDQSRLRRVVGRQAVGGAGRGQGETAQAGPGAGRAAAEAETPLRQQQAQTAETQSVLSGSLAVGDTVDPGATTGNGEDPEVAIEHGRRLFAGRCDFVAGIASTDALPPPGLPEIAFAGRSNVGKSSLINALTGRRSLARTSRTPGRTRQLNFFDLGGRLMLVDLPGYGYARASRTDIAQWNRLARAYLRGPGPGSSGCAF